MTATEAKVAGAETLRTLLDQAMRVRDGCGEDSTYEDDFVQLNDELYKLEGLSQAPVDWALAEKLALQVLIEHSTDIGAVIYWTRAAAETSGSSALLDGLSTLNWLLSEHGEQAWPRRQRRREACFGWAARYFAPALKRIAANDSLLGTVAIELATLSAHIETQLPSAAEHIDALSDNLPQSTAKDRTDKEHAQPIAAAPQTEKPETATVTTLHAVEMPTELGHISHADPDKRLQAVLRFSIYWIQQKPREPDGYRLLRQALWDDIEQIPAGGPQGRMPLMPVPAEREENYRLALENADIATVVRLEESLAKSPFWLTGHHLQANLLTQLGHPGAANAILQCAKQWIARLPGLSEAVFADNSRVVNDEVAAWLASASKPAAAGNPLLTYEEALTHACENADEHGVLHVLETLQNNQLTATSPREQFTHLLTLAAFCQRYEQPILAFNALSQMSQIAESVNLAAWEPELLEQSQRIVEKLQSNHPALNAIPGADAPLNFLPA